MSYQDVADLCGVSLGSVKRWMLNGRADEKAIQPLVERIGRVYLKATQVADHLEHLYQAGPRTNAKGIEVHRLRLANYQLERMAGREFLKSTFKVDLYGELRERGFLFEEGTDDFILVKWKWLHDSCAVLSDEELPDFYVDLAEEIDSDEID